MTDFRKSLEQRLEMAVEYHGGSYPDSALRQVLRPEEYTSLQNFSTGRTLSYDMNNKIQWPSRDVDTWARSYSNMAKANKELEDRYYINVETGDWIRLAINKGRLQIYDVVRIKAIETTVEQDLETKNSMNTQQQNSQEEKLITQNLNDVSAAIKLAV